MVICSGNGKVFTCSNSAVTHFSGTASADGIPVCGSVAYLLGYKIIFTSSKFLTPTPSPQVDVTATVNSGCSGSSRSLVDANYYSINFFGGEFLARM